MTLPLATCTLYSRFFLKYRVYRGASFRASLSSGVRSSIPLPPLALSKCLSTTLYPSSNQRWAICGSVVKFTVAIPLLARMVCAVSLLLAACTDWISLRMPSCSQLGAVQLPQLIIISDSLRVYFLSGCTRTQGYPLSLIAVASALALALPNLYGYKTNRVMLILPL